jgi:flagellar hook-associated protein 3 FlgL
MVTGSTLNDINSALTQLERSSSELSSGKSILQPSDNPYGASRAIELQSQLDGLSSYTNSAQDGVSWASTAIGAMSNMSELVQRARELLVQASNGTYGQSDRNNIATEIDSWRKPSSRTPTLSTPASTCSPGPRLARHPIRREKATPTKATKAP